MIDFSKLAQLLIGGLSVGATYALIALGYTLVYGVLRLINFAHGDVYMVGAVVGYYIASAMSRAGSALGWTLAAAFACAIAACAALGFFIEFLAYRPLRRRPRLVLLITAIGVSLLLENVFQLPAVFGAQQQQFPLSITQPMNRKLVDSSVIITWMNVVRFALCLFLVVGLSWLVLKTKTGLALRAVSFRFDTASLMGINTNRIISFTFMFGSALAAVAGVLDGIEYTVEPLMGIRAGLKAFVAAVLGGIGSVPGALVGALVIGLTETFVKAYWSSNYSDAVVFALLIAVLLFKPTGLLGRQSQEKL